MARLMQYVTFYLDEKLYGLDIRFVDEVNPNVKIMDVPLSDPHIRGVVNIRGQVALVIDIMVIFGYAQRPVFDSSHIIILKTKQDLFRIKNVYSEIDLGGFGDKPVGFLTDMIGDVISVSTDKIENPTRNIEKADSQFINGIVKLKENLLIIIDPNKLLFYDTKISDNN